MRAKKADVIDVNSKEDNDDNEDIDPLDDESEEKDDSDTSTASKIKTIIGNRTAIGALVFCISVFFVYKTFTTTSKNINTINSDFAELPNKQNLELKSRQGNILSKEDDKKINPFLNDKDNFGNSSKDFTDPDLPPLELGIKRKRSLSFLKKTDKRENGFLLVPLWVDMNSNSVQYDPNNPDISFDPKTRTLYNKMDVIMQLPEWINMQQEGIQYDPNNPDISFDIKTRMLSGDDNLLIKFPNIFTLQDQNYVSSTDFSNDSFTDQAKRIKFKSAGSGKVDLSIPTLNGADYNISGDSLSAKNINFNNDPNSQQKQGSEQSTNAEMQNNQTNLNQSSDGVTKNADSMTFEDKQAASMFVITGSPPTKPNQGKMDKKSDFLIIDESVISVKKDASSRGSAQKLTNLDTSILEGKILDAVLETSINTELPGNVRGVVMYDVYGEIGDKVLIPRGSRLYGNYSSTVTRGQSRIRVSWTRIIRPDGIDITIDAQAADQFGRTGVQGDVDNRFGDSIANSVLISMTTLAAGLLAQQLGGGTGQTQIVNPNGTFTTTNITPFNYAAQAAIQTANDMVSQLTQGAMSMSPIVTLPHGTKIKVVMQQDLRMPPFKKLKT